MTRPRIITKQRTAKMEISFLQRAGTPHSGSVFGSLSKVLWEIYICSIKRVLKHGDFAGKIRGNYNWGILQAMELITI
jgi:hypothetical protein